MPIRSVACATARSGFCSRHQNRRGAQWIRSRSRQRAFRFRSTSRSATSPTWSVDIDGRQLRPLHRAPWVDEPRETLPQDLPEGTVRLSGDFLCAPFSRSDVEDAPLHGWPANSAWDVVDSEATADGWRAVFRLRHKVMGATVDKILTLRDDHPFLYQEHVFSGGSGAISRRPSSDDGDEGRRPAGLFAEAICRDAGRSAGARSGPRPLHARLSGAFHRSDAVFPPPAAARSI